MTAIQRRLRSVACALCALLVAVAPAAASSTGVGDLIRAQEAYDQGVALKADGKLEAARAEFRTSAERYRAVAAAGGHNASLYYNLGNALVQSGDRGRGIASYLKALRLSPHDASLLANLNTARADVAMKLNGSFDTDIGAGVAWWRVVGEPARLWIAVVLWVAFWALLMPTILGRRLPGWARAVRLATVIAAVAVGGTVAADRWYASARPLAVVVADDVVLRKGNGDGFAPQVEETLTSGVELRVLETRPQWLRVRLVDGTEGWLRTEQVEVV